MSTLRPNRWVRIGDATSQWVNTTFFDGDPNESVSARAAREPWPRAQKVIDTVVFWERDHCAKSHQAEIIRAHELAARYPKRRE